MTKKLIGPVRYFKTKSGISAFLKGHEDAPYGWDYSDDPAGEKFHFKLRIGRMAFIDIEKSIGDRLVVLDSILLDLIEEEIAGSMK